MGKDVQDYFLGIHRHIFDSKSRVAIPAPFRATLKKKTQDGEEFAVAASPDETHLVIFSLRTLFEQSAASTQQETDAHKIAPFCEAFNLDQAGRLRISAEHQRMLGINTQSKLVLAGVFNRLEIWPEKIWDETEFSKRQEQAQPLFDEQSLS